MKRLESEVRTCEVEIRAGPGGESSDVYSWISSPVPDWAKTIDEPTYRLYTISAIEAAQKIVREIGKDITLKLIVNYKSSGNS